MIQFYFLSVFFNLLAGYIFLSGNENDALEMRPGFSIKDEMFKFVLGILSLVTGVLKLLSPIEGDVPVVGDLFPALAGLAAGLILIFEYYKGKAFEEEEDDDGGNLGRLLIRNKKIVAFAVIIAAGLHFLLPKALLL